MKDIRDNNMSEGKNCTDHDLVCVLFPGVVINEDKALECLGGIRNISQVYSQSSKRRLGFSFQPENPYVKKMYAETKNGAGVLMKVKVKKTKLDNEIKREVISTSIMGRVKKIYKFESMSDFQYLPVSNGSNGPQCILENLIPSGMDSLDLIQEPISNFILPAHFTRSEKPMNYCYIDKRYPDKKTPKENDGEVCHQLRMERGVQQPRFVFNLKDELPTKPHEFYIKRKDAKVCANPAFEQEFKTVEKLFEERPIWSMNLLRYHTKIKTVILKIIVSCLAISLKNGPWRMLWIRYGYDPRKEPGARIYQSLDFRLRHGAGVYSMVTAREHSTGYKNVSRPWRRLDDGCDDSPADDVPENAVYFRPGMTPAQRQIFYQYCDIKLPEVEAILAREPAPGALCHEQRGWLAPGVAEQCRDHIFSYVKRTLLATHNVDLEFEQASSNEDAPSDDDQSSASELEESITT